MVNFVQLSVFAFILDDLVAKGHELKPLLKESGLDNFDLSRTDNYVPAPMMYNFFEAVENRLGITDFLSEFKDAIRIQNASSYGDFALSTPDVLSAMMNSIRYVNRFLSSETDSLSIEGVNSKFGIHNNDRPGSGWYRFAEINLALTLDHFRLASGHDWDPIQVDLPHQQLPDLDNLFNSSGQVNVRGGRAEMAIIFPTELLSRRVSAFSPEANTLVPEPISGMVEQIEALLDSRKLQQLPTFQTLAGFFDVSSRSLGRTLQNSGHTYRTVVEQWRFKRASSLLKTKGSNIREISEILGYEHPQSFCRAFRRWSKSSPESYREAVA